MTCQAFQPCFETDGSHNEQGVTVIIILCGVIAGPALPGIADPLQEIAAAIILFKICRQALDKLALTQNPMPAFAMMCIHTSIQLQ